MDDPRKKTFTGTKTSGTVLQSLKWGDRKEISKVVKNREVA